MHYELVNIVILIILMIKYIFYCFAIKKLNYFCFMYEFLLFHATFF